MNMLSRSPRNVTPTSAAVSGGGGEDAAAEAVEGIIGLDRVGNAIAGAPGGDAGVPARPSSSFAHTFARLLRSTLCTWLRETSMGLLRYLLFCACTERARCQKIDAGDDADGKKDGRTMLK